MLVAMAPIPQETLLRARSVLGVMSVLRQVRLLCVLVQMELIRWVVSHNARSVQQVMSVIRMDALCNLALQAIIPTKATEFVPSVLLDFNARTRICRRKMLVLMERMLLLARQAVLLVLLDMLVPSPTETYKTSVHLVPSVSVDKLLAQSVSLDTNVHQFIRTPWYLVQQDTTLSLALRTVSYVLLVNIAQIERLPLLIVLQEHIVLLDK